MSSRPQTSDQIRDTFFKFFAERAHKIVPSAPIVTKNDPTLLFTNAGMNQFKDYFLGNQTPPSLRIADTQKCLRVSGKHNDLEEVGVDSYHHTMFEMLGNWSFGDYFKEEAIAWAWELLTEDYGLEKDRLYATIFAGDEADGLGADNEAIELWSKWLPKDRILPFGKKDNFWEMGDSGPCGPCAELHIDLRTADEREKVPGADLVNQDDPRVIEIWNLVFIQYNRKQDGSLHELPAKHIDTGMGFERLCMTVQGKLSSYDSDIFSPYIKFIEEVSGIEYTGSYEQDAKSDIAMRVIADHIRAVCFTVADGALPSNTGPGYVVRRILRRAVRYYYSFLNIKEPFMHRLVNQVAKQFAKVFPELIDQQDFVTKVVLEEERSFLSTLESGLRRFDQIDTSNGIVDGRAAFELYDTYGFPIDLTRLLGSERELTVDEEGFERALAEQRQRSRVDAKKTVGDWHVIDDAQSRFVGYDERQVNGAKVLKYRAVAQKGKDQLQIVLDQTPFYAEGGGQVGDTGSLIFGDQAVKVLDTVKENDLFIHLVDALPDNVEDSVVAKIDGRRRDLIENNHTATHLLHAALRQVLGKHVTQKGSLVKDTYLRFDFAHFQKMTEEEKAEVERIVNEKIRENIKLEEARSIPIDEAKEAGAMMLFGEKYGDSVRMITFDPSYSRELCGGCHVDATGRIGQFKITAETAVASGVRRLEATTGLFAEAYVNGELDQLEAIRGLFKNPTNASKQVEDLIIDNKSLQKEVERLVGDALQAGKADLKNKLKSIGEINFLASEVNAPDASSLKSLAYELEKEIGDAVIVFAAKIKEKPQLLVAISDSLTKSHSLHAGNMIRELAKEISGGGGGQPFFATAGGKDITGIPRALAKAESLLTSAVS